jgi:glycosyltransferase involved in cell wall biosynthesis
MSSPTVSVVTIFLDAARFLEEAVISVLVQTYAHWELLLVDDGSTDGSSEIAHAFATRHPDRIRYLEHPGHANRGMSASRNLGIRHARGEYIALLDADDVWESEKLAQQVALLEAHPEAGLVYGAPLYWYGWTGDPADARRDRSPELPVPAGTVVHPPELTLRSYPLGPGSAPCPSDLLFRRSVAERVGGFEERFHGIYALYEDQAFLAKVCLTAPVLVTDDVVAHYRQHPDSCYARARANGTASAAELVYLEWLAREVFGRHARERGAGWDTLRAILQRHRHPRRQRLVARGRRVAAALRARTRLAPLR